MSIEISVEARKDALESLRQYFDKELDMELGSLQAGFLLDFILEEIGPTIYNRAVADAQERIQVRIGEIEYELLKDEFQYWRKRDRRR